MIGRTQQPQSDLPRRILSFLLKTQFEGVLITVIVQILTFNFFSNVLGVKCIPHKQCRYTDFRLPKKPNATVFVPCGRMPSEAVVSGKPLRNISRGMVSDLCWDGAREFAGGPFRDPSDIYFLLSSQDILKII